MGKTNVMVKSRKMKLKETSIFIALFTTIILPIGECIKCFQCSSTEDQRKPTGVWSEDHYTQNRYEDNCGVYWPFEPERNVPVECNSDESHSPGVFLYENHQTRTSGIYMGRKMAHGDSSMRFCF